MWIDAKRRNTRWEMCAPKSQAFPTFCLPCWRAPWGATGLSRHTVTNMEDSEPTGTFMDTLLFSEIKYWSLVWDTSSWQAFFVSLQFPDEGGGRCALLYLICCWSLGKAIWLGKGHLINYPQVINFVAVLQAMLSQATPVTQGPLIVSFWSRDSCNTLTLKRLSIQCTYKCIIAVGCFCYFYSC